MNLFERIPANTNALLFDMDGVLVDTLTLAVESVDHLLSKYAPLHPGVPLGLIKENFAYDVTEFWRRVLDATEPLPEGQFEELVAEYENIRRTTVPKLHSGVVETLSQAKANDLILAVVSNNSEAAIKAMLANVELTDFFDVVVGNDQGGLAKKPAPDSYLEACRRLGLEPGESVVIEDSLIGIESGRTAGCFVVGVATGASSLDEMQSYADVVFADLVL